MEKEVKETEGECMAAVLVLYVRWGGCEMAATPASGTRTALTRYPTPPFLPTLTSTNTCTHKPAMLANPGPSSSLLGTQTASWGPRCYPLLSLYYLYRGKEVVPQME